MEKLSLTEESYNKIINAERREVKKPGAANTFLMSESERKLVISNLYGKWKEKNK